METNKAFEQEVNQIRLASYEKTRSMTPSELTEYYKQSTESIIKEYGFKVVALATTDTSA